MALSKGRAFFRHWFGADGGFRTAMARGVSGLAILRLLSSGLRYLLAIAIARLVGADGLGVYAFANSWITLAAVLGTFGLNTVAEREVAGARARGDWASVSGVLLFTLAAVLILGLATSGISVGLSFLVVSDANETLRYGLWIALAGLPVMLMMRQLNAAQAGFQQVVQANLSPLIGGTVVVFVALGGAALLIEEPSELTVMWCYLLGVIGGFLVAALLTARTMRRHGRWAPPGFDGRRWLAAGGFLSLMGAMHLLNMNVDILMLGSMEGEAAAGVYGAVTRGAEFTAMALVIFEGPLRPMIASLLHSHDRERLKRIVTNVARASLALGVAVGGTLLLLGDWYLYLFGPDFQIGWWALVILVVAQVVNVAAGPVLPLLVMSSNDRTAVQCTLPSVVANVVLNYLLIPEFGINGAAMATASSIVIWNALMLFAVWRTLGIDSTALGLHRMSDRP